MAEGIDRYQALLDSVKEAESLYDEMYQEDYDTIDIENSVLSIALKNQIQLQMRWEEMYREFESLYEQIQDETDRMFSLAFKELNLNSYKQLSFQEAKLHASSDSDYVEYKRLLNRMNVIKCKTYSVVDTIKSRRYLLKNVCDVLYQGNESYII